MSPASITRRGLVQAGGAAFGATVAGISVSAMASPADPDAGLFDLIARHDGAVAAMEAAELASNDAYVAFLSAVPPRPDALRMREDDFPRTGLGVGLSDEGGDGPRWYGARGVEWMRDRPAAAWFPGRAGPPGVGDEARRLEIIGAWDDHAAARRAVEVGTGYRAASEASDAAADLVSTLAGEVARTRPRTLAGLRALGAWFARQVEANDLKDDFLKLFAATVAGFGEVAS